MKEFITHYRVIYADTDCMGIVYHANYLRLFEYGRTDFLREIGCPYEEILAEDGLNMPLVDIGMQFKKPARYGEQLKIVTFVQELKNVTVTIGYKIFNEEEELLVTGHTRLAFTNPELKPVALKKQSPRLYEEMSLNYEHK